MSVFKQANQFLSKDLWAKQIETLPLMKRVTYRWLRLGVVAISEFQETALSFRATGLVYMTLLSLVPFLAVMVSVLKAFGVHLQIEPVLAQAFEPLGPKGAEITSRIIGFISNLNVKVLGAVGVGGLFLTTLLSINQIEHALNAVWRVKRPRPLAWKFTNYLSVILVGPVLVFTAIGLTATAQSHWIVQKVLAVESVGFLVVLFTRLMPFLFLCLAFTFLYKFLPYTEVKLKSALVGGITAGVLWQLAGMGFAFFVVGSAKYTAIYSSLAILIIFLIWLYIAWVIVLAGAQVAYFHQYPYAYLNQMSWRQDSQTNRERLGLNILVYITQRYLKGLSPYEENELSHVLNVPLSILEDLIEKFIRSGVLCRTLEPKGVILGKPPEQVSVVEVLNLIQEGDGRSGEFLEKDKDQVSSLLRKRDQAVKEELGLIHLKSLVEGEKKVSH
ncbi:MAG TPA: YhjD/YihY/BrkB family envelope integrity protein [Nitrospiria bacterium]|jgi:membrane protein